ncbi:unnamed protein product [Prunus armeniaca]
MENELWIAKKEQGLSLFIEGPATSARSGAICATSDLSNDGTGSSMSSAHDDPFILQLGGGRGQSSLLRTAAVPSGEVVNWAIYTWLLKGRGHA